MPWITPNEDNLPRMTIDRLKDAFAILCAEVSFEVICIAKISEPGKEPGWALICSDTIPKDVQRAVLKRLSRVV